MKICVFGTRGFPGIQGGVEKHCEKLYQAMPSTFNIVVYRRKAYVSQKTVSLVEDHIHFVDITSTRIKGFETFIHSFIAALRCCFIERPDVVHVHNIGPGLFIPLLKLFRLRVVMTYHSPNYEHEKWGKMAKNILRLGEKLSLKFADKIIFVNQFQRNKLGIDVAKKSVYLGNGVDLPSKSEQTDFLSLLSLIPHKYVLAVGRITQEKGFDYLIDAFLSLNSPDYKLVIAGSMDHKQGYAKKLHEQGLKNNIVFTGYVDGERLNQLYTYAALFVLPSYNEGFPLVLLEAMSYDLPVLVSDIPANRQVMLHEDNYFKVGDRLALSEHISAFLKDKGTTSYDLSLYDWEVVADNVIALYKEISFRQ